MTPSRSPINRSPRSAIPPSPSNYRYNPKDPEPQIKDLSFLLHPSFYISISQSEVPPQFRIHLQPLPPATSISESLASIEKLLSRGEFLAAAHIAAGVLTSAALDPTDVKTIADLLSIRYSCLELTGNALIAAQESKALEDLNSDFYYIVEPAPSQKLDSEATSPLPHHILPFQLRLQAARLQSIGFSDPRRGVSALYELGLDCREHIASPHTSFEERESWERRLAELGIRVVNALIEINDLECAKRTLHSVRHSEDLEWRTRMGLLLLKIGDMSSARKLLQGATATVDILAPLLATAEGRYEESIEAWENFRNQNKEPHLRPIVDQNLAVNYLYAGRLKDARQLMEDAVEKGEGYGSLTFNLATIYELSSEKARDMKMNLASNVASQEPTMQRGRVKVNADFKL